MDEISSQSPIICKISDGNNQYSFDKSNKCLNLNISNSLIEHQGTDSDYETNISDNSIHKEQTLELSQIETVTFSSGKQQSSSSIRIFPLREQNSKQIHENFINQIQSSQKRESIDKRVRKGSFSLPSVFYGQDEKIIIFRKKVLLNTNNEKDDNKLLDVTKIYNQEMKILKSLQGSSITLPIMEYKQENSQVEHYFEQLSGDKDLLTVKQTVQQMNLNDTDKIEYEKLIVQIFLELCHKLSLLHNKYSIAHSDIKPSNIVIGYDQEVYFIDFGGSIFIETQLQNYLGMHTKEYNFSYFLEKQFDNPEKAKVCDFCQLLLTILSLFCFDNSEMYAYFQKQQFKKCFECLFKEYPKSKFIPELDKMIRFYSNRNIDFQQHPTIYFEPSMHFELDFSSAGSTIQGKLRDFELKQGVIYIKRINENNLGFLNFLCSLNYIIEFSSDCKISNIDLISNYKLLNQKLENNQLFLQNFHSESGNAHNCQKTVYQPEQTLFRSRKTPKSQINEQQSKEMKIQFQNLEKQANEKLLELFDYPQQYRSFIYSITISRNGYHEEYSYLSSKDKIFDTEYDTLEKEQIQLLDTNSNDEILKLLGNSQIWFSEAILNKIIEIMKQLQNIDDINYYNTCQYEFFDFESYCKQRKNLFPKQKITFDLNQIKPCYNKEGNLNAKNNLLIKDFNNIQERNSRRQILIYLSLNEQINSKLNFFQYFTLLKEFLKQQEKTEDECNYFNVLVEFLEMCQIEKNKNQLISIFLFEFSDCLENINERTKALLLAVEFINEEDRKCKWITEIFFKLDCLYSYRDMYHISLKYSFEVLRSLQEQGEQDSLSILKAYINLGINQSGRGNNHQALQTYIEGINMEIINSADKEVIYSKCKIMNNMAQLYNNLENYSEALKWGKQSLDTIRLKLNNEQFVCNAMRVVGDIQINIRQEKEGIENLEQAYQVFKQNQNLFRMMECCCSLTKGYIQIGDYEKAKIIREKAIGYLEDEELKKINSLQLLQSNEKCMIMKNLNLFQYQINELNFYQGEIYQYQGNKQRASEWYEKSFQNNNYFRNQNNIYNYSILNKISLKYFDMEDYAHCLKINRKALEILLIKLEEPLYYLIQISKTMKLMSECYQKIGQTKYAEDYLKAHDQVEKQFERQLKNHNNDPKYQNIKLPHQLNLQEKQL